MRGLLRYLVLLGLAVAPASAQTTLTPKTTPLSQYLTGDCTVSVIGVLKCFPGASLVAGTNVTITGTWPNQTINATGGGGGSGTVTSVGWIGGIVSVATPTTTPAFTIAGTSGGIPYFSSGTTWASSAVLGANLLMQGGGAGAGPSTFTLGGDCTFLTPNITCPSTNGVPFGTFATQNFATPPAIGGTTPAAGNFTTLSASGVISGNGFITLFANPPAIGVTTPNSGAFTTLTASTPVAISSGGTGQSSANAAFNALSPMTTVGDIIYGAAAGVATRLPNGTSGQFLGANTGAAPSWQTPPQGTVTSVGWVGGIVSIATATTTPAFTIAGTSGGIPYFASATTWASSAALTANKPVIGGGAGAAPSVGTVTGNTTKFATSTGALTSGDCTDWDVNGNAIDAAAPCGTVTSVSWTGGLISVATATTTPAFTVAGTSGGIPYFSGAATWASSAALTANLPVIGGGAGTAPSVGTVTGNTTKFATSTGALTSGHCANWDANGNVIDAGAACASPVNTAWSDFSTTVFYPAQPMQLAAAVGATGSANVIQCTPTVWTEKMTLPGLSANITTLAAAGNFQLALYTSVSGRPGVLIAATGSGSTAATGFISPTFASNQQVGPGGAQGGVSLWACANRDNATVVFTPLGVQDPGPYTSTVLLGSATTANLVAQTVTVVAISCSGAACNGGVSTFGTWPTLTGSTWTDITNRSFPIVFYKPTSIP